MHIDAQALFGLIRAEQDRLLQLQRVPDTCTRDNALRIQTLDWVLELPETSAAQLQRTVHFSTDLNRIL